MSSKRRLRRRQCVSKVRHLDQAAAHAAITQMARHARRDGRPIGYLQPYRCAWCSGWHVGHGPHKLRA